MPIRSPISLAPQPHPLDRLPPTPVGVYAQLLGAAVLSQLGYQLATPLDATLPYDLLGTLDPEMRAWSKIQIKQASRSGTVGLRRGDKRRGCKSYRAGDFDLLLVVDRMAGVYVIPYRAIQYHRSQVCVRDVAFRAYRVTEPHGDLAVTHVALPTPAPVQLSLLPALAA